jgi:hypothetical protein
VPRPSAGSRPIARQRCRATEPPSASRPIRVTAASVIRSPASSSNRSFLLFRSFPLFDRAAGFPSPRPQDAEAGARRACQGWPALQRPPAGLGLDAPEHDGTLVRSGPDEFPRLYAASIIRSGRLGLINDRRFGRPRTESLRPSVRSGPIARQRRRATEPPTASRPIPVTVPTAGARGWRCSITGTVAAVAVVQAASTRATSLKMIVSD